MDTLISGKRLVGCFVALVLACALMHVGSRPVVPADGAVGIGSGDHATAGATPLATTAVKLANNLPSLSQLQPKPESQSTDAERFLTDLLVVLNSGRSEESTARIEQLVAGQRQSVLQDLIEDQKSVIALPDDVLRSMFRRLVREDAPRTGDYVETMLPGPFRAELLGALLAQWGADDLPAAIKWAKQLGDASLQETALIHLSYRWFETDPNGALAFAALHPAEHRQLLTTLVGQWSREQPETAAAWAAEFSNEPVMANVAASAVAAWAEKDALVAAEFVLKLPAGNLRQEAAISVMSALAQKDPETGALWATAFPAGPERDYAIENLFYDWAATDSDSAFAWANHLSAGERDTAIFAGAGGLIEDKPALAANWAMSIQNESRRAQQAERAAQRWLETDRWAAEAWIRQSMLPSETKARLLASAQLGS